MNPVSYTHLDVYKRQAGKFSIAVSKSGKMALVYTSGTVLRTEVREGVILNFSSPEPLSLIHIYGGHRAGPC